ncbi:MAG: type IX secretion system outer membrane channel protein PorV [Bacteroidales bacterium]|nr:type IX secretion system outer membrane channel protein PorV [Bacteroidales bacterium]MCF8404562.1 type IX secretion system outer membrane channel protein PorV [Bacteroidales bacterium]
MKRLLVIFSCVSFLLNFSYAQNTEEWNGQQATQNTITTAVPFLNIGPDARSGGMGELGAGTSPDAMSQHWNPAKFAFIEKEMGFAVSYSPWLRKLVNDINLAYLSGYKRIDEYSTVSGSLKFFSLGDITFTRDDGSVIGIFRPSEFSLDGAYARKFSEKISGAVAARFIYSNLTQGQEVSGQSSKPGTSIAADVSFYYTTPLEVNWLEGSEFSFGAAITNIGQKISYSNDEFDKDFIPTNLRIGPSWLMEIDDYNSVRFSLDLNKLLVPTPPVRSDSLVDDNNQYIILAGKDDNVSVAQGMIQSFYDSPSGFSEEMKEIIWVVGAEYWYDKQFAIRAGYFHESEMKGNRKFFTLGAGLRYNVFGLDFSYLIPTAQQNPLANTLRFTLTFNFDGFEAQQ